MAKARYAIVHDGVVWSVTEWDAAAAPNWAPPFGEAIACDASVASGDLYDGQSFTRPAPVVPVPQAVTKLQLKKAMTSLGLWDTFWVALNSDADAKLEWDLASDINRNYDKVLTFQQALNKTDEELDNLFRLAGDGTV